MKILITGANGFIGKNLIAELTGNPEVSLKVISREKPSFPCEFLSYKDFHGDNFDPFFFNDINQVIHLAAVAHRFDNLDEKVLEEINDSYLKKLVQHLNPYSLEKFFFMSSFAVSLLEKNIILDTFRYAEFKKNSEDYLQGQSRKVFRKTSFVFLRPPMVYGKGAPGNFQKLLNLLKKPVPLPFGRFHFDRSFIHVKNLTSLISHLVVNESLPCSVNVIEPADPWDETFASFCSRLSATIKSKAFIIPFPVKILEALLTVLGKGELFKKLTLSYKINYRIVSERYHWIPPVNREESFNDLL